MAVDSRYRSQTYGMQFASFGVLLLIGSFLAPFLLAGAGAGPMAVAAACLVPLLIAGWMFRLMVVGGVRVKEGCVSITGWRGHRDIPAGAVQAVMVRRDGAGEPAAWLDVGEGEVFLRGVTHRHRHSPFRSSGRRAFDQPPGCDMCREQLAEVQRLADQLDVPLVEAGARRGAIPGFW